MSKHNLTKVMLSMICMVACLYPLSADDAMADDYGVSVKGYGAVGDGTTDDTDAIQDAIDYCRDNPSQDGYPKLIFPTAGYKITSSLDFTGFRKKEFVVDFQGSTIIGETDGNPILDLSDSQNITMKWRIPSRQRYGRQAQYRPSRWQD